jgi:ceramide glucosyltransferase
MTATPLLLALWACLLSGAYGTATLRALRNKKQGSPKPNPSAAKTVLFRPCAGDEPKLRARLMQTGGVDEVWFAVGANDSARSSGEDAVHALTARGIRARAVLTTCAGPNHKAAQLAELERLLPDEWEVIACVDSDVELLDFPVHALLPSHLDASWAPTVQRYGANDAATPAKVRGGHGLGDMASAAVLAMSFHAFPFLGTVDPSGLVGKVFAIRRAALRAAGGFASLTCVLGEDMALARKLGEQGARVAVSPLLAFASARQDRFIDSVLRFSRWASVIRSQRPMLLVSYPLFFFGAFPCIGGLLGVGLGLRLGVGASQSESSTGVACIALSCIVLFSRFALAAVGKRLAGISGIGIVTGALLSDLTLALAFVRAIALRTLRWNGRALQLRRHGLVGLASDPRERALEGTVEPDLWQFQHRAKPLRISRYECGIDTLKLALNRSLLLGATKNGIARRLVSRTERDPQTRTLAATELVAKCNGEDTAAVREPRDFGTTGQELKGLRDGSLAALGKHPNRAALTLEESGPVANRACAIPRIAEVDPECANATEERQAREVFGVHERKRVAAELAVREIERYERVPPGGVVADHDDGRRSHGGLSRNQPVNPNLLERAGDSSARMAGKESLKQLTLFCWDHE